MLMNMHQDDLSEFLNQGLCSSSDTKSDVSTMAEFQSDMHYTHEDMQICTDFLCEAKDSWDTCVESPLQILGEVQNTLDSNEMIDHDGQRLIMSIITSVDQAELLTSLLKYVKQVEYFKTEMMGRINAIEKKIEQKPLVTFACDQTDYCFFGSGTYLIKDTIKRYGGIWGSFIRNRTHTIKAWYIPKNGIEFMNHLSDVTFVYGQDLSLINLPDIQPTGHQPRIKKF